MELDLQLVKMVGAQVSKFKKQGYWALHPYCISPDCHVSVIR